MRKIYLATSWKNVFYEHVRNHLIGMGHEVYDFRDEKYAFKWSNVGGDIPVDKWTIAHYRDFVLPSAEAIRGFDRDKAALDWCDTCIYLEPCGKSASWEAGYAVGQGKQVIILLNQVGFVPELMYKFADHICLNVQEVDKILELQN